MELIGRDKEVSTQSNRLLVKKTLNGRGVSRIKYSGSYFIGEPTLPKLLTNGILMNLNLVLLAFG